MWKTREYIFLSILKLFRFIGLENSLFILFIWFEFFSLFFLKEGQGQGGGRKRGQGKIYNNQIVWLLNQIFFSSFFKMFSFVETSNISLRNQLIINATRWIPTREKCYNNNNNNNNNNDDNNNGNNQSSNDINDNDDNNDERRETMCC